MNCYKLDNMVKGWFVGDFSPVALSNKNFEVAIKKYNAGDFEPLHVHKIATELTAIVSGRAIMCGKEWGDGDIIILSPGDETSFEAVTDVVTVVVKTPSVLDDKYLL